VEDAGSTFKTLKSSQQEVYLPASLISCVTSFCYSKILLLSKSPAQKCKPQHRSEKKWVNKYSW
jgi:hypothetical protein